MRGGSSSITLAVSFALLAIGCDADEVHAHGLTARAVAVAEPTPELAARYLGDATQAVYLIRPDQHVVARWSEFDAGRGRTHHGQGHRKGCLMLILTPNLPDPDGFYDELIKAHDTLTKEQSDALNARLILTLANHIGNRDVLREALHAAK